ncbi:hypothetical protein BPUM_3160 [Bacillus pumilus SAFR-032]|uniref:Uncharacterized protein n=1 Tax=Bacillus pumilus (strain SAFR-032) TaxID=315750 RepID=A8FHU7_BACP2|nr:hypothetical protein BPUM_3160 [Bacillus pumilus SAFR-032]
MTIKRFDLRIVNEYPFSKRAAGWCNAVKRIIELAQGAARLNK